MSKAIVLGAKVGSGNIGDAVAAYLVRADWRVWADDCYCPQGTPQYRVPDLTPHNDANALVVTLGKESVTPFQKLTDEEICNVTRACLTLPLMVTTEYLRVRDGRGGVVVFIGSYSHEHPMTNGTVYCAAKAGLDMATKALGWELSAAGYSFHIVHPWQVMTAMLDRAEEKVAAQQGWTRERVREYAHDKLQQPAMMEPEEVAKVVGWLCEGQPWLSGQAIKMYGGTR